MQEECWEHTAPAKAGWGTWAGPLLSRAVRCSVEQRSSTRLTQLQRNLNIIAVLSSRRGKIFSTAAWQSLSQMPKFQLSECLKTMWRLTDYFYCEFKAIVMSEMVSSMLITEFKLKATTKRHKPKCLCLRHNNWYINKRIRWNTSYLRKCICSKTH